MRSLSLNLLLAAVWLFLQSEPSVAAFAAGFALGFGLLALFQPILGSADYIRRMLGAGLFLGVFLREFLRACAQLIWLAVATPVGRLRPDFVEYDVTGLTRPEVLLLSHCISLTPGTNTVDISPDFRCLRLHVLDCPDPDAVRASIDRTLRRGILAFTR
jgi:multicomponent Na+:H+ antiporter subunit E